MVRIALTGYRRTPQGFDKDIIFYLPHWMEQEKDLKICHTDIVEERGDASIEELVEQMLETSPDILVYTNYRDYATKKTIDSDYIDAVKERSGLPILLLSGAIKAEKFAKEKGITYSKVPISIAELSWKIREEADIGFARIDSYFPKLWRMIEGNENKPVAICLYGMQHHGKSYFAEQFIKEMAELAPSKYVYMTNSARDLPHFDKSDYFIVHIPIGAPDDDYSVESSSRRFKEQTGRNFDLKVLVHNPNMHRKVDWQKAKPRYDLIVINEGSVVKRCI